MKQHPCNLKESYTRPRNCTLVSLTPNTKFHPHRKCIPVTIQRNPAHHTVKLRPPCSYVPPTVVFAFTYTFGWIRRLYLFLSLKLVSPSPPCSFIFKLKIKGSRLIVCRATTPISKATPMTPLHHSFVCGGGWVIDCDCPGCILCRACVLLLEAKQTRPNNSSDRISRAYSVEVKDE